MEFHILGCWTQLETYPTIENIELDINYLEQYRTTVNISPSILKSVHNKPDYITTTSFGLKLSFKYHETRNIILGTDISTNTEKFVFVYWIPKELKPVKSDLVAFLELFIHQFGVKLKINDTERYVVKNQTKFIDGELNNFDQQIIEFDNKGSIHVNNVHFYSSNLIGKLNHVHIHYLFSINIYKYQFWLFDISSESFQVRSGWYDWVDKIKTLIRPDGRTKIEVYKSDKNLEITRENQNQALKEITVPSNYKYQFKHLIDVVNSLADKEKIGLQISNVPKTCIFCGSDELSKEHIIPDWAKGHFKNDLVKIYRIDQYKNESYLDSLNSKISAKKTDLLGFTDDSVCVSCNTGWMSNLEEEVILILLDGNKIKQLSNIDKSKHNNTILSKWVMKIALLTLNKLISYRIGTFKSALDNLKNNVINEGFFIEIGHNPNYNLQLWLDYGNDRLKLKKIKKELAIEMCRDYFQFTFQFGHLLFRLSYLDPSLPFHRESGGVETELLYPFNEDILFHQIKNEKLKAVFESEDQGFPLFTKAMILAENDS